MHVRTWGGVVLYAVAMIVYLPAAGVSLAQVDAMIQREVNRRRMKNEMPVDCNENVHASDNAGGRPSLLCLSHRRATNMLGGARGSAGRRAKNHWIHATAVASSRESTIYKKASKTLMQKLL